MITPKRFSEMMGVFAKIWPREGFDKNLVDIYYEIIKEAKYTEDADIEAAYKLILATNKYKFPDPSSFIEALGGCPQRELMAKLAFFRDI
jgi:hypothetical protein